MKKKDKIQGYLNSLKPTFSQSGDTLTLVIESKQRVGQMIFNITMTKGKKITQRVIQMVDCDTIKMIEEISHIVPLSDKDIKTLRMTLLEYSREKVNDYFGSRGE